jgi:hypothetical protein
LNIVAPFKKISLVPGITAILFNPCCLHVERQRGNDGKRKIVVCI